MTTLRSSDVQGKELNTWEKNILSKKKEKIVCVKAQYMKNMLTQLATCCDTINIFSFASTVSMMPIWQNCIILIFSFPKADSPEYRFLCEAQNKHFINLAEDANQKKSVAITEMLYVLHRLRFPPINYILLVKRFLKFKGVQYRQLFYRKQLFTCKKRFWWFLWGIYLLKKYIIKHFQYAISSSFTYYFVSFLSMDAYVLSACCESDF